MKKRDQQTKRGGSDPAPTRRQMLKRLGLAATAVYAAPVLLRLSSAKASPGSGGSFSGASGSGSVVRRAPPPPPELVVAAPSPADLALIAAAGYEILSSERVELLQSEVARIRSAPGRTLDQARTEIAGLVPGALLDLNHLYRPNELNCEPEGCAAFEMIGWTPERSACGLSPSIGMIDTAINGDHAALQGSQLEIVPAASGARPTSSRMHGTAIAVLLVGRTDSRTPGLLPEASLVAVEAFHANAQGDAADAFDLVRAIDILVRRAVGVINMSFAGPANDLLQRAVMAAHERNVAMVAAAGNDGPQAEPRYPAAYEPVVAVTAVDREGRIYRQAVAGDHIAFAAPGVRLWTAASISGGRLRSGTSYAAPFVTAALAAARAQAPERPLDETLAQLADNAVDLGPDGRDETFGWGLVRVEPECMGGI